ncbi:MAG: Epsin-3, clathrin recruitment and traffic between the Golgi and endosome [Thelocarpon impressellum]|nr:MAG: Epsin-3, clathrin recruitment and traffic between the Golgi and endosome [Thelocarpon impressellum]
MDLNTIKDQVSNLTLYDIKAGVRKVQNAVMNYTEMEAKVREATNNEPWGASSTLMQEIANGTYNYSLLNEIMPMIYKRFTEKAAEEWRQIYKGLQLLEFLIKNGSERVIDEARSHLSLLKMLRQFHFIDQNGKDQGINVRNRAKELADLLSDVDRIRAERKKARTTRNKYGGIEGGASLGGSMSGGGGRHGGFGSEEAGYGGYSGGVYGDGGGFGGNASGFQDSGGRRDRFEEYDEYDEGAVPASGRRKGSSSGGGAKSRRDAPTKKTEPPKPKEPEVDLFSFVDDERASPPKSTKSNGKQPAPSALDDNFGTLQSGGTDDDDFDDFQSATPAPQASTAASAAATLEAPTSSIMRSAPSQLAAPKPISGSQGANLNDLVGFASISPAPSTTSTPSNLSAFSPPPATQKHAQRPPQPAGYQAAQPNYFTSVPVGSNQPQVGAASISPAAGSTIAAGKTNATTTNKPAPSGAGGDAFGSIWSSASAGIKKTGTPNQQGPNLASMAKEKASAGIWGAAPSTSSSSGTLQGQMKPSAPSATAGGQQKVGGGLDDLLG